MAYDSTKIDKKAGFHPFSRKHIFGKTTGGGVNFRVKRRRFRVKRNFFSHKITVSDDNIGFLLIRFFDVNFKDFTYNWKLKRNSMKYLRCKII